MDIFLASSQNWTSFRGLFYVFLGVFFKVNVQNEYSFWGCKNFKYFPDIPNIFGG